MFQQVCGILELPWEKVASEVRDVPLEDDAVDVLEANFEEYGFGYFCTDLTKPYDLRELLRKEVLRDTRLFKVFRRMNASRGMACVAFKESRKGFWLMTNVDVRLDWMCPHICLTPASGDKNVIICRLDDVLGIGRQ